MQQDQQENLFGLNIDSNMRTNLFETAKWARFLAIVGFVICGLIVIVGIIFAIAPQSVPGYNEYENESGSAFRALGPAIGIFYILIALLYFFPCLYMLRFANKMKIALTGEDPTQLSESFQNLKSLFRFLGILTIIVLAFYFLVFVGGILGGA